MKKQFNLRLDDRTRYDLATLADLDGKTLTKVIHDLIDDGIKRRRAAAKNQQKLFSDSLPMFPLPKGYTMESFSKFITGTN